MRVALTGRLAALLLFVSVVHVVALAQAPTLLRNISFDFPHGGLRLLVDRDGPSQLFYAAAPFGVEVAAGTFDLDALHGQFVPRLQPVSGAETRPPGQPFGTVTLGVRGRQPQEYLIVDQAFAEGLLLRACANVVNAADRTAWTGALVISECARLRSRNAVPASADQDMPPAFAAMVGRARLDGPVAAWCAAEFRPGARGAMAVAISAAGGGRYVALDANGTVSPLAAFAGRPDLACYTRAAAENLNRAIKSSDTIHGEIAPRFDSTVVCGFVDATSARCWQFAPDTRAFVVVGGWMT
jgi:hypothetical protein